MGRVTRKKAAEIAEQLHVDEDAVLDMNMNDAAVKAKLATPQHGDRSPLGELEPNSAESKTPDDEPAQELRKSTRGRKAGKKGAAKGKKSDLPASTATVPEQADVVPDDNESAPSPASEKAAEELISPDPELAAATLKVQDRSQSPPSAAVRLTRSQLTKKAEEESEPKSLVDGIDQTPGEGGVTIAVGDNPTIETPHPTDMSETATATPIDAPASPLPSAVPNVIKNLRSDTPGKRSTSNKENVQPDAEPSSVASPGTPMARYDALEDAVVAAATPPRSEPRMSPRPEDHILALDELEEAVESVSNDIPQVQTSSEKPKPRKEDEKPEVVIEAPKSEGKKTMAKKESQKAAPVVRTTKASQARISLAQNKDAISKPPSFGRPRPSTTLGRSNSVRQSVAPKAEGASKRVPSNPTTSAAVKPTAVKPSTASEPREKKETVIPHSKPRPVSLSFPTPPPPAKSTKAATQSTFQLPGEAVAAKLKAAREARMAKEAADAEKNKEKKAAFKARPAPKASGIVPSVRPTNASRARESIISGKPAAAPVSHKRSNTVAAVDRPRNTSSSTSTSARPSATTTATTASKPRPSTSLAGTSTSTSTAPRAGSGTSKGKEVFSRAANAKAAAEREKAEKEAAAKKARAEAAERGRVASREWAEKQRLRKLGIKPEKQKAAPVGVVVAAEGDDSAGVAEVQVESEGGGVVGAAVGASEGEGGAAVEV